MSHIAKSATDLIGNTPLLELGRYCATHAPDATILAKLEFLNPAGSAKDRIAKAMIDAAEAANGTRRAKTSSVLQDFRERQERLRATARLSDPEDGKFDGFGAAGRAPRLVSPRERMLEQARERLPIIAERQGQHA